MAFLSGNILGYDDTTLIWYRPASNAEMTVKDQRVVVALPALVFAIRRGTLRVAALKTNERPTLATKLFHSGFPNVGDNGRWCSGGNRVPEMPDLLKIDAYEEMFFISPFTHAGGSGLKGIDNVMDFWGQPRRKKNFPLSRLESMQTSLQEWISE